MRRGFTLVELLVVITIVGILASIAFVSFAGAKDKARDAKRKAEISQFGRLLTLGCFVPSGGPGEYDLVTVATELSVQYPQYSQQLSQVPRDPKTGTGTHSNYRYVVTGGGACALYGNLESEEAASLSITEPTAGAGTGVFRATSAGWNGSKSYFQVSS